MFFFVVLALSVLFYILDHINGEQTYAPMGYRGYLAAIRDTYALSIGDFEGMNNVFADTMGDYTWLYWTIFFFGTVMQTVILLNMVVGIMSMRLETVTNDQEALVNREKLIDITNNFHRMPSYLQRRFKEDEYLFIIEVDPHFDLDQELA